MDRRARVAIATASLVTACAEKKIVVDASDTVALELGGVWSDEEQRAVVNAAASWNLEFGTQLRLAEFGDEAIVVIDFSEDACFNERRQKTHARATTNPPAIHVCPETAIDQVLLFETVRHELGHILGIPVHASDSFAVMTGKATNQVHWFRDEDRDLFFANNPGFAGNSGCALSPRIADGTPMLAHPADRPLHLVWAKNATIRFAPLSKTGVLGAEAGRIVTEREADRLHTHPTKDGFLVTWFEENRMHLTSIALPDGKLSEKQTVELEWPMTSFYRVSEQHAPPYYWLALTIREGTTNTPRTTHVVQLDERDGSIIATQTLPMVHGQLVTHDGQPFLVTGEIDTTSSINRVRVHRIDPRADGFEITESIDIASVPYQLADLWAVPEPILNAHSTPAGIVVLLETSADFGMVELIRVTTANGLAVDKSVPVYSGLLASPVITAGLDRVFVGATILRPEHYQSELYVLQLSADTLEVVDDWRILSAADTVPAEEPRLAISSDNLVAVWKEPSGDVRSRCLSL